MVDSKLYKKASDHRSHGFENNIWKEGKKKGKEGMWKPLHSFLLSSMKCIGYKHSLNLRSDYCYSVTQLCPTLFDPMDCSMPPFLILYHHTELAQTHVSWVGDPIQPSHPLLSPSLPAFNLSQQQGFFSSESVLLIRWLKYWSFSISPSK